MKKAHLYTKSPNRIPSNWISYNWIKVSLSTLLLFPLVVPESIAVQPDLTPLNFSTTEQPATNNPSSPLLIAEAKKPRQGFLQRFRLRRSRQNVRKNTRKRVQRRNIIQRFRNWRQRDRKARKNKNNLAQQRFNNFNKQLARWKR